uniref:Uncharacterized protein n=1 Tax=Cyprinus carpio carpio TaxID=630221 RepID=A0A9J7Z7X8_CYPCA
MLLFHFLCIIVLKETFILASNSKMRRVWCSASHFISSISSRTLIFLQIGKLGRHVIRTKEDKDNPSCYQHSVQKPASLMVWGCMSACGMGSLHIWKGTINAERYIQVLEQHMLPSRCRLFQGGPCIFQHDNSQHDNDHILHRLQHHGCVEEGSGY